MIRSNYHFTETPDMAKKTPAKPAEKDEQDSPWKKILRQYFQQAIEFFCPEIAKVIDWSQPIEFLDKEFTKIAPNAETGSRFADQLVKVYRKDGQPIFLLIHLEVQASRESGFSRRIFTYSFRIFDYLGQPATSVVILCDSDPNWRPKKYSYAMPGTTLNFEFSTVKLLDYRDRWDELEASQNPFAWVVMAHLKMQETRRDKPSRKVWKMRLIRGLHESGYNKTDVLNVFNFVDWVLGLPKPLEIEFWRELKTYEEGRKVPYITSVERIGYERGVEEGAELKARSLLLRMLDRKVGSIPSQILAQINGLSIAQLDSLGDALLDFTSIDDLTGWLDDQS
jgi:Domain of unknown function (DUF4351)